MLVIYNLVSFAHLKCCLWDTFLEVRQIRGGLKQLCTYQSCSTEMGMGRTMRDASIKPSGVGDADSICQAS